MRISRWLLVVAVLVAVLAVARWWTSDARRIGRKVDYLIECIEKSPGEGKLAAALKAEQLGGLFADAFVFRARPYDFETQDRQTLIRTVALYRLRSERIGAQVLARRLDIDAANRRATMTLTTRFTGGWRDLGNDALRFQINWREDDGEWQIDTVDLLEVVPAGF